MIVNSFTFLVFGAGLALGALWHKARTRRVARWELQQAAARRRNGFDGGYIEHGGHTSWR